MKQNDFVEVMKMNSRQAAEALNVGISTVTRWLREGKIKGTISVSGRISIPKSEIDRLIADNQYLGLFQQAYHGKESSFEVFKKWAESRKIVKYMESSPHWRKVTKNGLRGLRYPKYTKEEQSHDIFDHYSLWKDADGKKVICSQPYQYLPGDTSSCFGGENDHYKKDAQGNEEKAKKYIEDCQKWANERGLEIKFFPANESWYYPGNTILIEIREGINGC
jgi:excisionase family DNA binding protein